jgi:hemin uptake protein HemP
MRLLIRTILTTIVHAMKPESKPPEARSPETIPPISSEALLQGRPEVLIRHEGRLYRLRRTRLGKLILTA